MERTTKIIIGVIVFGFIVPIAVILPLTSHQDYENHNLAGIRDYKAGRYDVAIPELSAYLKAHPLVFVYGRGYSKSDYAEEYFGLALMKQKRYEEAAEAFRVYAQCSDGEAGNYLLGEALLGDGKKGEAKEAFVRVIKTQDRNASSRKSYHLSDLSREKIKEIDQNATSIGKL